MVDHKVRHLEQSFVALKFCVRIEVAVCTHLREPAHPLGKSARIIVLLSNR